MRLVSERARPRALRGRRRRRRRRRGRRTSALRFDGFVERQCLFNTVPPILPERLRGAPASRREVPRDVRMAADYFVRQGRDADALAAELDTPEKRRRYIGQFYGSRFWAAPGTFRRADVDFMTEPFADADQLRAGFGIYETALGTRPAAEPPRLFETQPGADAAPVRARGPRHPARLPRALRGRVHRARSGPFVVQGAGHFLQWERADVLNQSLVYFFADLREVVAMTCPSCRAARRW